MIKIIKKDLKFDNANIDKLATELNTTKEVISLLLNRGYSENEIKQLIETDYDILKACDSLTNCKEAATILADAILDDKAEIYIYADYDCDGIMSGSIAKNVLNDITKALESKCKITVKMPNRHEGYGLSMKWCKKKFPRKTKKNIVVMTVDNGITKHEEVEYLKSKGINVIISDHHVPKEGEIPDCLIVDAWLNDKNNKNALGLCGAAVTFLILGKLLSLLNDNEYIYNYLPYAAIATITDVMPATPLNMSIMKIGLDMFNSEILSEPLLYYKKYVGSNLSIKDIAFGLGPQMNACGRMGDTEIATEFLCSQNEEKIEDLYSKIANINDKRKAKENAIIEGLKEIDYSNDLFIIVYIPDAGGITGTLASKLVNMYNKPTIVFSGNGEILTGSARSAGELNLHEVFNYEVEKGNVLYFGGHHLAAGVTIEADKLLILRESLNKLLLSLIVEDDNVEDKDIEIKVDDFIHLKDISTNTLNKYTKNILYFGTLKEPTFALKDVKVIDYRRSSNNPNHICLVLEDETCKAKIDRKGDIKGKEVWIWNKANEIEPILKETNVIDIIGKIIPDFRFKKLSTLDIEKIIPA